MWEGKEGGGINGDNIRNIHIGVAMFEVIKIVSVVFVTIFIACILLVEPPSNSDSSKEPQSGPEKHPD